MREIKFRIWDKQKEVYLPEHIMGLVNGPKEAFAVMLEDWENYQEGEFAYPEWQTLELFVGLKDKNGKEIYEGDIVKTEYGVGYSSKHYPSYKDGSQRIGKLTVEWEHCGFNLQFPYDGNFEMTFEVIGNIHQNPDLL